MGTRSRTVTSSCLKTWSRPGGAMLTELPCRPWSGGTRCAARAAREGSGTPAAGVPPQRAAGSAGRSWAERTTPPRPWGRCEASRQDIGKRPTLRANFMRCRRRPCTVVIMGNAGSDAPPGRLAIQLQPQVGLRDGSIDGAEVLARWLTPDGRVLGPAEFLPLLGADWSHPMFGRPLILEAIEAQVQLVARGRDIRLWVNLVPSMLESTGWLQRWLIDP
ncbi:MAG: EAL domain-containing protein, partial [Actinobacteria bacterium]|nr:EAL domain-containing protein [Actinomycetota bacterium]